MELSESNGVGVKYGFIVGLKKIVIVELHFTNNHKQKRKSKQQTKRKKIKTKLILGLT